MHCFARSCGHWAKRHASMLFSHLQELIAYSTSIAKENMGTVAAEMQSLRWMVGEVYKMD